jgi:phospholipase/carboxylesterase
VIPLRLAQASRRILEEQHYAVEWKTYPMGHAVCATEIRDIAAWLTTVAGR